MSLLDRFVTVVKSNLNALISKAEDPEQMLNQMLLDMQEQLINAKKQVAISIADEKRLAAQYQQEKSQADEWEKRAMLAVRSGSDDLAKQALERKADHDKQAQGFYEQWQLQKDAVEKLKVALTQLNEKIVEAKRKKNLLVSRAKRAEAQKTITETMSGISQNSALETINRMEEKINRMEAEAQATSEMAREIETDELAAKFEKLDTVGTDEALLALKSKMGIASIENKSEHNEIKVQQDLLEQIEKEIKAEATVKKM